MNIDELCADFQLLENWDDRYAQIIAMGANLPKLPADYYIDATKVSGCMAQVWMVCEYKNNKLQIHADSDAAIVKGLIALLKIIYQDKSPLENQELNLMSIFDNLGLSHHLSPNRRNGFFAMVERIKNTHAS